MESIKYHLTYNGSFSQETYIEHFNPEKISWYHASEKGDSSSKQENACDEARQKLEEVLANLPENNKNREEIINRLCGALSENQCQPKCKPCGEQKYSENLYFAEEYERAILIIKEIVKDWGCETQSTDLCERMRCQWDRLPKNNRILFHGSRGSGKTSVTMSVAKSIEGHRVGCTTFKVLPIINPGYFDEDTNILKTVISNMFEMAKCIIKSEKDIQQSDYEELLRQFEEVYRLLGSIENPNKEKHTLETLNEISKASGMREAMQKLVDDFRKILPCKANCLVLVIDDVDMSVAYAATMLEQIKKFLELDNLLILMSANLEQLHNEMREHYSQAFKETLKDENQSLSIDVEDLASKYLLKLFPTSRRINVERPVTKLLQTKLIINNEKEGRADELQKVVLSLIWDKTRLLFIPKDAKNTLHPIIPTNLRELAQLLELLIKMDNVGSNPEEGKLFANIESYNNCRKNINTFKSYFLNVWVPTHLPVDEEWAFINIPSDITEINKHLINSINAIGTKHKKHLMSREVSLDIIERNAEDVKIDRDIYTMVSPNDPRFVKANKISDIFNQPSNYSYGDLLLMIDKYETYFESEEDRRFSNAIKIYYSILLFETMFFKSTNVKYDKKEFDEGKKKGEEVIPIQKLIGGTVYYPNYFEIISSKYFLQKGPSYDAKRAFYHKIPVEKKKKENVGSGYPLFSVLYYGDIRPDRYDPKHIYDTTFDDDADIEGTPYVTFDILSVLNNTLNPLHTYDRSGKNPVNLEKWGKLCTINDKVIPNSILPFYSVDIMLQYLKKTKKVEEVLEKNNDNIKFNKELNDDFDIIKAIRNELLKNNDISVNSEYEGDTFSVTVNNKSLNQNVSETSYNQLKAALDILKEVHKCYSALTTEGPKDNDWFLSEKISVADRYRDHCIATVISNHTGGKKEKETIIKGLRKIETISEMYKYLVEQLWENEATERLIHEKIQEKVHAHTTVRAYYKDLNDRTKELLNRITIKDIAPYNLYNSIFNEALNIYIPEPTTKDPS